MVTYRVTVNIDENWVGKFNSNGMRLCFASAVDGDGSSRYNVVAFSDSSFYPALPSHLQVPADSCPGVSESNTIEWEETYMIAASKSKFMDGGTCPAVLAIELHSPSDTSPSQVQCCHEACTYRVATVIQDR